MRPKPSEVLDRVITAIESYELGVNQLGEPAFLLDTELPESLSELYQMFDGAELFHEDLVLFPSASLVKRGDRYVIGEASGDDILVEGNGRVVRIEKDTGDEIVEGTAIDRWLSGFVDAAALLYERDGEFRDGVFTESGEVDDAIELQRQRCFVKRDPKAPGPRWRLARQLVASGAIAEARDHLEDVVAVEPDFGWAWFDLAKISEATGELEGAFDEMEEAARAAGAAEHEGFFLAHLARLAQQRGDEATRQAVASRALAADAQLVDNLLRGADAELEQDNDARPLYRLLAAVAPRDLRVLDLGRRLA